MNGVSLCLKENFMKHQNSGSQLQTHLHSITEDVSDGTTPDCSFYSSEKRKQRHGKNIKQNKSSVRFTT